MNDLKGKD